MGTRLLLAGISQLTNPGRTSQGILGIDDKNAEQVVHELGFANLSFGLVATATSLIPEWGLLGAVPGAIYLGLAGVRHVGKRGKNTEETRRPGLIPWRRGAVSQNTADLEQQKTQKWSLG